MEAGDFKAALLELGWNQSEFARKVGMTPVTASRYATGDSEIPLWVERHLSLALEVQRLYNEYVLPHGNAPRSL